MRVEVLRQNNFYVSRMLQAIVKAELIIAIILSSTVLPGCGEGGDDNKSVPTKISLKPVTIEDGMFALKEVPDFQKSISFIAISDNKIHAAANLLEKYVYDEYTHWIESVDGLVWTIQKIPIEQAHIAHFVVDGETITAVGGNLSGKILRRDEGNEWRVVFETPGSVNSGLKGILKQDEDYIAYGVRGQVYLSKNDKEWNAVSLQDSVGHLYTGLTHQGATLVAGDLSLVFSEDLNTWNMYPLQDLGLSLGQRHILYASGRFFLSNHNKLSYSIDGLSWTEEELPESSLGSGVIDDMLYILQSNNTLLVTTDGENFETKEVKILGEDEGIDCTEYVCNIIGGFILAHK